MQHLRIKLDIWHVRAFYGLPNIAIRSLICLSLLIFATSAGNALEISVNLSTGGTLANNAVYGVTVDGSNNVTSWGSNYIDYVVKFQSNTGSTVNIDDFKVQLTANAGQNVGTNTLNVTWFNWADATSQTNPVWANRVGSLSVPSSSVSASFTTYLVGPGSFSPSPIPALSTGSSYFFRIWSQGGNSMRDMA